MARPKSEAPALTPAERQAARRARINEEMQEKSSMVETLMAENTRLQAENQALRDQLHAMELATLKAKLRAAKATTKPASTAAKTAAKK